MIYWYDEAYSSIAISGYTKLELENIWYQRLEEGKDIDLDYLQKFQYPQNPNRTVTDTIDSIGEEEPQNSPLYFALAHGWGRVFGSGVFVARSLASLLGVGAIAAMYVLSRELFGQGQLNQALSAHPQFIHGLNMALMAVSPMQLLYAQENRQYSLFILLTLLSTALLLRSVRINTLRLWGLYAITITLGLYSHLFFVFVAIAHGLSLGLIQLRQGGIRNLLQHNQFRRYLLATTLSFLLFARWIFLVVTNLDAISDWRSTTISLIQVFNRWLLNLCRAFIDWPTQTGNPFELSLSWQNPGLYVSFLVLLLVIYSLYALVRYAPISSAIVVLALMGTTAVPLIMADLTLGGVRSTVPRYLLPSYLGLQLTVAFGLCRLPHDISRFSLGKRWGQAMPISRGVIALVLTGGIISCLWIQSATTWWTKYSSYYDGAIAQIINQTPEPLVISDDPIRLLSLSHLVNPNTHLQLNEGDTSLVIENSVTDIFVFTVSQPQPDSASDQRDRFPEDQSFELVYQQPMGFILHHIQLWQRTRIPSD